ncbi:MAG TPA: Uma2 family endonuclease [Polyangia bacterium]|nr:Uma2 family endonuclease [Polyangia bacterium]
MRAAPRNFSRVEYDKMIDAGILGEDERVELVDGTIVEMSPEGVEHAGTIDLCAEVLRRAFGQGFTVRVQHPIAIDPDGEPQPDLAVVAGEPRMHLAAHPTTAALLVEVSASSLAYDRTVKARLYARAGVPEYWIVNLVARTVEVHREPSASGFGSVESVSGGELAPLAAAGPRLAVADLLP